ncbi:MAG: hypothetical protein RL123_219 [Pseudomonadota bacterium]
MDVDVNWSLWRAFLAVAEAGSLSAAARATGASQPTMGRQIRALESALGVELFVRQAQGLVPSPAGSELLEHARAMRAAAARAELAAAGQAKAPTGTVRITASRIVACHLLPPILSALRAAEPGIEIDLVPTDESENLLLRESDIAVRMYRPTQLDLVARQLGALAMGLYAAPSLIARHGMPNTMGDLLALPFVGFDRDDRILQLFAGFGYPRRREDFPVRCDDQLAYWALVRAGCGLGGMQCAVADPDPAVRRVAPFVALPPLPVWLVMPGALRSNRHVRRVWEHLANTLGAHCAAASA